MQLECTQQARAAVEQDRMVVTLTHDNATEIDMLKRQHKTALCDTQVKHVLCFEKQKLGMTGEMNQLSELLFGQNEMIDGCLDEMRDEHKAAQVALASANQLKIAATGKMEKVKWWKGKCDELKWLNNAYIRQSMKIEEMQLKINEYKALAENMTEVYEETILSMCPQHIEKKACMRNLTNKYGHQEWKPFVDKLIIELLCNHVPPTCIQLVMVTMSKGESITCVPIILLSQIVSHHALQSTVIFPGHNVICELPSLHHIRMCRIVLLRTTKTLAVFCLGKATKWKQLHTDDTGRHQKQLENVVINIIYEAGDLKSICLSGSIIAEDSTAEEQS